MKDSKPCILVVDDSTDILFLTKEFLQSTYELSLAIDYESMLNCIKQQTPDLILLDLNLNDKNGLLIFKELREKHHIECPIIIITHPDNTDEEYIFSYGIDDFISKPFKQSTLKARIQAHLRSSFYKKQQKQLNAKLEQENIQKNHEIHEMKEIIISSILNIACIRDNETGNHLKRTANYVKIITEKLKELNLVNFTDEEINLLSQSAPLHDIGKVGIPDHILLKPGKLTFEEFEIMKSHTTLGYNALNNASFHISNSFLTFAKQIIEGHHEKWDGSGYPKGLKGEDIPISARIMACADVYDALISKRPYKKIFTHEEAKKIIIDGRGTHFDPIIVDVFLSLEDEIIKIANKYSD